MAGHAPLPEGIVLNLDRLPMPRGGRTAWELTGRSREASGLFDHRAASHAAKLGDDGFRYFPREALLRTETCVITG